MTDLGGWSPDPPSRPVVVAGPPTGCMTHGEPVSDRTAASGYVSHPTYTRPPVWRITPGVSIDEVRLTAQRYANESGMTQRIVVIGDNHPDNSRVEILRPGGVR